MPLTEFRGLVIRQVPIGDNDKLLTLLTAEEGKVSVMAKGVRSIKSKLACACEMFCYGCYVVSEKRGKYWVRETDLIENFFGLREDISRLSLAGYICDVINDVSLEGMPEGDNLRLSLNALAATEEAKVELDIIKAAFEWRLAAQLGFEPQLSHCSGCGESELDSIDIMGGRAFCKRCSELHAFERKVPISRAASDAVQYVSRCDIKKLLSFNLAPEHVGFFADAGESYLLNRIERSFESLKFYKAVKP